MARFLAATAVILVALPAAAEAPVTAEDLGEALFFDLNLSASRSQSCATCHNPDTGFSDPRGAANGAYSLGDDGESLGDRNAPSAAYAAFAPAFHRNADDEWVGGQFWDGRAATLEEQAGGPPLNPAEMAMPSKAAVLDRLTENRDYVTAFPALYGDQVLSDPDTAFDALTRAIAAFERTEAFAPFDSKYDRYLRGEAELSKAEELGRVLFFSEQFTNCNQCHQLKRSPMDAAETFTDYRYHNIGVPENRAGRALNGVKPGTVDSGLLNNPAVTEISEQGKFRTPILRNVAVTGPYMHNGVFQDLRTVLLFYNRYNTKDAARQINPETGKVFGMPEVPHSLAFKELTHGPALEDQRIDALVAFLRTLTDQRYEHLLDE